MIQNVAKVSSMYPNPLGSSLIKEYDLEAFKNERIMKHKLTCFYLLIAIRILYRILISCPDLGCDFGMIQNVAKVCRMLTNLLGSSWSKWLPLEAALGNVLDLKSKYIRTKTPTKFEYELN